VSVYFKRIDIEYNYIYDTMKRKPIYIFTSAAHWPLMREVVGSKPVIGKDFLHFLFLFGIFNTQTDL